MAVKAVAPLCQLLLVVGSQNSSNSRRLVEVCEKSGVPSYLVDDKSEMQEAGSKASARSPSRPAPRRRKIWCRNWSQSLQDRGFGNVEEMEIKEEDVRFHLPRSLRRKLSG